MKTIIALLAVLGLSGCSTMSEPSSVPATAESNAAKAEQARIDAIDAEQRARSRRELVAMGVRMPDMTQAEFDQIKKEWEAAGDDIAKKEKARREDYVAAHPELPADIRSAILDRKIAVGMSPEDVAASWGQPGTRISSDGIGGKIETIDYGGTTLYFSESRLVRWAQISRR